ncbi:histidine kinase [Halosquirtibacter xylanolyticus]|uniref:sensor histidine kinase n=1 Tax=Halosquirtibacter xylanolyticus TaxID=3374599 RepID=UPI0037494939|nr:histidine kinase [Prolixibacteraceae bacterium]
MQIIALDNKWITKVINNRWVQHTTYWIIYVAFFAYAWGTYDADYIKTISVELINLPAKIALVYTVVYILYPKYLYKGRIWRFLFYFSSIVIAAAMLQRITDNLIIVDYFFPEWKKVDTFTFSVLIQTAINLGAVLALPMTIKLMEYIASVQHNEQVLAKEKLEAELAFLRNQVQPHFLFNTLNSLYALILKQSNQSLDVVLKLSELLRYMLYETNATKVDLRKEIQSVQNYLDLEKIRYGNRVEISLNMWGNIDQNSIAPMLILPFIENSFKHGTQGLDESAWITIEIGVKEHRFTLKIENSIPQESADIHAMVGGIGLQNVKRRLSLIYPEQHTLKIEADTLSYSVFLNIEL